MEAEAGRIGYPEGQRLDVELSWKKKTWIKGLGEVEKAVSMFVKILVACFRRTYILRKRWQ